MKRLMILFAGTLSMAACTSQPEKTTESSDTTVNVNTDVKVTEEPMVETLCFQKLAGTANQDTTSLKLTLDGDNVTGDFGHYPKEKDRRVGRINATRDGDLIKGTWVYMQEGTNDTLQVEFKLSGDKLVQKNYTIDPKTGREVFSDASVFNIEFDKVDCKN
ncbi:putative periplasmic lipoprotein [Daejeonella lutea]|uniref:NlpE N-terminal domain-containing protein n=1 Tax=Daejeonella lutea TaxID=572036 RepID=A0A1T5F4W4_9SPHI|nr:hypothetical protein [Daejeonella lutea]SKB91242.1 hypothetical protein SAMN05661099_3425 [Daejeonella lutea]